MKSILLTMMIVAGLAYGCDSSVKSNQTVKQSALAETDHHHDSADSIVLNNGQKWKVVPNMLQYIRNMETDVAQFSKTENSSVKDYNALGEQLQKNIDLLTSNCTMEGQAHDELHKWLLPFIDMVDHLKKSTNTNDAALLFSNIKNSFQQFNANFE